MHLARLAPAVLGAAMLLSGAAHGQATGSPKPARNYDCSKAGNANKAVCKSAAAASKPMAAPAAAPAARPVSTRNYDCSKAGNANKAVCRGAARPGAATVPAPVAGSSPSTASVAAARTTAPAAPAAVQRPAPPTARSATAPMAAAGPNGATAQCRDGTYSHSAHRSGTCAGHKGVQTWF